MGLLAVIALVAIALWLGLTFWFRRMLNRDETSPVRRLGNTLIAGFGAALVVVSLAYAVVSLLKGHGRF